MQSCIWYKELHVLYPRRFLSYSYYSDSRPGTSTWRRLEVWFYAIAIIMQCNCINAKNITKCMCLQVAHLDLISLNLPWEFSCEGEKFSRRGLPTEHYPLKNFIRVRPWRSWNVELCKKPTEKTVVWLWRRRNEREKRNTWIGVINGRATFVIFLLLYLFKTNFAATSDPRDTSE